MPKIVFGSETWVLSTPEGKEDGVEIMNQRYTMDMPQEEFIVRNFIIREVRL